ncbi:hypothetical protein FNF31_07947 [Cafeteria roenbergensis]|uniref:Uncharacterized protein n=1 Tax=Cafeteria roenbergensis TaxID=33653 RepID=A0A5A8BZW3_CAFRO|nr:hypothetical protein FNF31_07947 [Cafeteria roenbergensis]
MADFEAAKAFLQTKEDGVSLFDHLTEVLLKVITEHPENAVEHFERISAAVKSSSMLDHKPSAGAASARDMRVWGRLHGLEADYIVAEGKIDPPEDEAEDEKDALGNAVEPTGTGANTCTYWIARISAETVVCPAGHFKRVEDEESRDVEPVPDDEYAAEDPTAPEGWVHIALPINALGRTAPNPKEDEGDEEGEEPDPELLTEPLKPITDDAPPDAEDALPWTGEEESEETSDEPSSELE